MPQFNNQLFPRTPRRPQPTAFEQRADYNLDLIGEQLLSVQLSINELAERLNDLPLRRRASRGQPITHQHLEQAKAFSSQGMSLRKIANTLGISVTAVSLLLNDKYPFAQPH